MESNAVRAEVKVPMKHWPPRNFVTTKRLVGVRPGGGELLPRGTRTMSDGVNSDEFVICRHWDMPNSNTFLIPSIKAIVCDLVGDGIGWLDPFANANSFAETTNDLNERMPTDYHLDALDFLKLYDDCSVLGVLLDPPYSARQVVEVYEGYGRTKQIAAVNCEAARVIKVGGTAVSFGWNSNGIPRSQMFKTVAVHLVAHGGSHNDTIITVQNKVSHQHELF